VIVLQAAPSLALVWTEVFTQFLPPSASPSAPPSLVLVSPSVPPSTTRVPPSAAPTPVLDQPISKWWLEWLPALDPVLT
jgi:hypothetical protein